MGLKVRRPIRLSRCKTIFRLCQKPRILRGFCCYGLFYAEHEKLIKDRALARTNYSFEKRQKELAKKKKKEEKRQRKLERQKNSDGERGNGL